MFGRRKKESDPVRLIKKERAPAGLRFPGTLNLREQGLTTLPEDLHADVLEISGCNRLTALPRGLRVRRLNASGCISLEHIPEPLECDAVDLSGTAVKRLPDGLRARFRLDLTGCMELEALPKLDTGALILRGCRRLTELPEDLHTKFLDLQGCARLRKLPETLRVNVGRLDVRGCVSLTELPSGIGPLSQLDVSDCEQLASLGDLEVTSWIELAGSSLTSLPARLPAIQIRWRGVPVDARIAFRPHEITTEEVLKEENTELRRVKLERVGFERFLAEANALELDRDTDAGGERRLLRVPFEGDEDLVCLSIHCPSTERHYMLRVPPTTTSCRHATAWAAGFDNPDEYEPIHET